MALTVSELPGLSSDGLARVILMVSELVTNVLVHTDDEPVVTVEHHPDRGLVIEVADRSALTPAQEPVDPQRPSGRGMHIVADVSDGWGVRTVPGGKAVWFLVALR